MMWKTKTTEIGKLRGVEEEIEVGRGSPQLLPDSDYLLSGSRGSRWRIVVSWIAGPTIG